MISIQGSASSTTIIKKSKFLGYACRINDETQARESIAQRKKQHYDASHNCFAYVLRNGVMRYSDDNEPQGTAGLPMLGVLQKNELADVLVIATRYFGGTLLGTGGLVRAYTKAASSALFAAQKVQIITRSLFETSFSYATWSKAQKLLSDSGFMLHDTDFSHIVRAKISALPGEETALHKLIENVSLGKSDLSPLGTKLIERKI